MRYEKTSQSNARDPNRTAMILPVHAFQQMGQNLCRLFKPTVRVTMWHSAIWLFILFLATPVRAQFTGGEGCVDYMYGSKDQGVVPLVIWEGTTDSDWFTLANWRTPDTQSPLTAVPLLGSDTLVIIPLVSNPPRIESAHPQPELIAQGGLVISENATLSIAGGTLFTISDGATVTTEGSGSDQGRIILEPGARYVNLGKQEPLLEVQQQLTGSHPGWRMLSPPVATKYEDMFAHPLVTQGFTGASHTQNPQPNLLWWDETIIGTTLRAWRTPGHINNDILPGRGHFHFVFNGMGILDEDGASAGSNYPDALPITMSATGKEPNIYDSYFAWNTSGNGAPLTAPLTWTKRPENQDEQTASENNTTFIDINLSCEGWNLIGNPTASTLDWDAANPAWINTNIDNSIYIWNHAANNGNGEYLTWNGNVGTLGNGHIAPFQAFWVRANDKNPALSFNNLAKTYGAGEFYRKDAAYIQEIHIPMKLESNGHQTKAYISLTNEGVTGRDPWDAYRLEPMTQTWLALYMNSSPSHAMPLVINNLPLYSDHEQHIPLYVNARHNGVPEGGRFTVSWELPPDWPHNKTIVLMDHVNKKALSMARHNRYSIDLAFTQSNLASAHNPLNVPTRPVEPSRKPGENDKDSGGNGDNKSKGGKASQWQQFSIVIGHGNVWDDPEYITPSPRLMPPNPNPAKKSVTIRFRLIDDTKVRIDVYDSHGRFVATPFSGNYPSGLTEMQWQPPGLKNGLYIIKMNTPGNMETQRLIIIN